MRRKFPKIDSRSGQPTHGETGDALVQAVHERLVVHGINVAVHTFGCGGEHDADVLTRLANLADGRYYYVETAEQIGQALALCFASTRGAYFSDLQAY